MAKELTSCGIPAYSDESGLSGAAIWKNYAESISVRAEKVLTPILEMKGQKTYKTE